MDFAGIKCISQATYYRCSGLLMTNYVNYTRYQSLFMLPTIEEFWNEHLLEVHAQLSDKSLIISGDGRCDSPGSSAKFCTYTLMDTDSNLIIYSETVTKQEVWQQYIK